MRDRRSQLPGCRLTIRVSQLGQAIPGFAFGNGPAMPLVQQNRNQPGLYQQRGRNRKGLPAVPLPIGLVRENELHFQEAGRIR